MNRGQLRLRVIQAIGTDDTAGEEEVTLVNDLLQEGIYDILVRTRLSLKCLDITLEAGKELYDIPDQILYMQGLYDSEGDRWLRKSGPELIDEEGEFVTIGSDLLKIVSSDEERTINAYYVPMPAPMSNDAHDPSSETYGGIPVPFHKAIWYFAAWQAGMIFEHPASRMGESYRYYYEGKEDGSGVPRGGEISKIRKWVNQRIQPAGRRRPPVDGYRSKSYI